MDASKVSDGTIEQALQTATSSRTADGSFSVIRFTDSQGKLLLHENLKTAGDKIKTIEYSKTGAIFKYSGWTEADIVLVDDTTALNDPTVDGYVLTNASSGTACSSTASSKNIVSANLFTSFLGASTGSNDCGHSFIEWSLSGISNSATISNVVFKFDLQSATNARNCSYMPIVNRPNDAGTTDQQLLDDILDGTPYVSNDSTCTTTGNNKSVDLGSSADSAVQTALTSTDWFAIGIKAHDTTRDASTHDVKMGSENDGTATPKPTLEVTYSITVTVPIALNMRTGSDTPETAGVGLYRDMHRRRWHARWQRGNAELYLQCEHDSDSRSPDRHSNISLQVLRRDKQQAVLGLRIWHLQHNDI
jgi:hypothetical protein